MSSKQGKTTQLTGTAILAALVIVFDYTLKYSGLKIPFPWYPNLKFDFTGIPIILSLLMYGLPSALSTSLIAGLGIFARSGNLISASMKSVAELSTVLGLWIGEKIVQKINVEGSGGLVVSTLIALVARIVVMTGVNIVVLPNVYGVPVNVTYSLLPLIAAFNTVQGLLSVGFGYFLHDAVKKRLPN
ncbi:MAG: hypothetical protein NWE89_16765 [Candidatus Bathyarchaeota archaeon]|nr:hypothetical protein [Candidatus Bathyarchaeota archaeon]